MQFTALNKELQSEGEPEPLRKSSPLERADDSRDGPCLERFTCHHVGNSLDCEKAGRQHHPSELHNSLVNTATTSRPKPAVQ